MHHPIISRMGAFFCPPSSLSLSSRGNDLEVGYRDEDDGLIWKNEHQHQHQHQAQPQKQKQKGEDTPFPCPSFMNTALTYIHNPTYTHIPLSSTTIVSSSPTPQSSSSSQNQEQGINIYPLATAFANLAVEAGIYGTRESYIEVLSFQLRRMVRSLGGQSRVLGQESGGGGGSVMINVTRAELNCIVHIEIQTRRKCITRNHRHRLLDFLNRERDEMVVLVALSPVVKPAEGEMDLGLGLGGSGGEGVFSVWRWREMRFGGDGGVGGEGMGKGWKVCRGEDLGWGLRGMGVETVSGMGRAEYKDDNEGKRELVGDSEGEIENEKEEVTNGIRENLGRHWMQSRRKRGRGGGKRKRKSVLLGGDKGIEVTWEWEEEKSLL